MNKEETVESLEEIKRKVKLTRNGYYFHGRCPFSDCGEPAFTVSTPRKRFYCFGCSRGGSFSDFSEMIKDPPKKTEDTQETLNLIKENERLMEEARKKM
jgi:DNA primase